MKLLGIGDLGLWAFVRRHPLLTMKSYWKHRRHLWRRLFGHGRIRYDQQAKAEPLTKEDVLNVAKSLRDLKCDDCGKGPRQVYVMLKGESPKNLCGECAEKYRPYEIGPDGKVPGAWVRKSGKVDGQ